MTHDAPWAGEIVTLYQVCCAECGSGGEMWDAAAGGKREYARSLRKEGWDNARWRGWTCPDCSSKTVEVKSGTE